MSTVKIDGDTSEVNKAYEIGGAKMQGAGRSDEHINAVIALLKSMPQDTFDNSYVRLYGKYHDAQAKNKPEEAEIAADALAVLKIEYDIHDAQKSGKSDVSIGLFGDVRKDMLKDAREKWQDADKDAKLLKQQQDYIHELNVLMHKKVKNFDALDVDGKVAAIEELRDSAKGDDREKYDDAIGLLQDDETVLNSTGTAASTKKAPAQQQTKNTTAAPSGDRPFVAFEAGKEPVAEAYNELFGLKGNPCVVLNTGVYGQEKFSEAVKTLVKQYGADYLNGSDEQRHKIAAELYKKDIADQGKGTDTQGYEYQVAIEVLARAAEVKQAKENGAKGITGFGSHDQFKNEFLAFDNASKGTGAAQVAQTKKAKTVKADQIDANRDDAALMTFAKTEGASLKQGDGLGDAAQQAALVKLGQDLLIEHFGELGNGGDDGKYGEFTRKAAEKYQAERKLKVTGEMDRATILSLKADEFLALNAKHADKKLIGAALNDIQELQGTKDELPEALREQVDKVAVEMKGKVKQGDGELYTAVQNYKPKDQVAGRNT